MSHRAPTPGWRGLLPAATTPFSPDGGVDRAAWVTHARWLADHGAAGIIAGGSLGEGASLSTEERLGLVSDLARAAPSVRAIAAVGATRTREAIALARGARDAGALGLLLLPPYVYRGDRAETRAYFASVLGATDLPCLLYNNPAAYGTDVAPEDVLDLATEHSTLTGVKESSGDVRRITALRALLGDRIEVAVGLDDLVLEGVRAGAVGWVAGLANALPDESAALLDLALAGERAQADSLYRWFLPLLRLDTGPKFVQWIKLVQSEVGAGSARVRPPRQEFAGTEREDALALIRGVLAARPALPGGRRGPPPGPGRSPGSGSSKPRGRR